MKHIPNLLTAARIAAAPYLFWLLWRHQYGLVIPLFIVIGITDVLDGFLARTWKITSRLGAYLDPIADKLLLSGTILVLALTDVLERWVAVVVLGRDVLILVGAGVLYLAKTRRSFPPSVWGKLSTFVQIVFVCFLVGYLDGIHVGWEVTVLKWATVALAFLSFGDYVRKAV